MEFGGERMICLLLPVPRLVATERAGHELFVHDEIKELPMENSKTGYCEANQL